MTKEERQLLIKDLCGRLPYGVYVDAYSWQKDTPKLLLECVPEYVGEEIVVKRLAGRHSIREIKPYLRPMSSMTKEEKYTYRHMLGATLNSEKESIMFVYVEDFPAVIDWLNAHHFDYRDLIEKGLALEAPEGMYKTE
jgi:hypothetical protein